MRYLCIHSHCYQPPRENPWLESIEVQDSAYPYHDWNDRVTAECYAPNSSARILDGEKRIVRIVNNYSRISFNFGPTLLSWMQRHAPETYENILKADKESRKVFSGHGSAIAQGYNHIIMPLANTRDKRTQIIWGIADFKSRFGRDPESLWLPETAVDLESLDLMAQANLKFAILAPNQARAIRRLGDGTGWIDCSGSKIDPSRPYLCKLPSGRSITLFFYDGPVSQAVAFEKLLDNGERFAHRLVGGFSDARIGPQLMHIATDGETYGHHHTYGEMALAYALHYIQSRKLARITNYGEFLSHVWPKHEVQIHEHSSWSCVHGIERWRSNCGCNSGRQGWHQEWRKPLREALDWLRDRVAPGFEVKGSRVMKDPWAARDAYISVILDPGVKNSRLFEEEHFIPGLDGDARVRAWKLLEMQRHAMLMYTSCGWFFDELSGLETVQVIQYAGRVVQLFEQVFGCSIESEFERLLACAKSNFPEHGDGAAIYRKFVKPAVVDLENVGAHYAISSLFEPYAAETEINSFSVKRLDHHAREAGKLQLAAGKAEFASKVTGEARLLIFAALKFGDHNLLGAVKQLEDEAEYDKLVLELMESFSRAETPEVVLFLGRRFGGNTYSLKSLFRDEQRKILKRILASTLAEAESVYLNLYQNHAPLIRFISGLNSPVPKELSATVEYAVNSALRRAFSAENLDAIRIHSLLDEAAQNHVSLDITTLEYILRRSVERTAANFAANAGNLAGLEELVGTLRIAKSVPFPVILWSVQNKIFEVYLRSYKRINGKALKQDPKAVAWISSFRSLAVLADVKVE
jgi:alpha-amylase/alpha-mannosidase (GH57 family)